MGNGVSVPSLTLLLSSSFCFLGPHLKHMEAPRLGVTLELQPPTTATATWDLSRVCDPHHSSHQRRILNPLSRASDRTRNLMDTKRVRYHWTTIGTPTLLLLRYFNKVWQYRMRVIIWVKIKAANQDFWSELNPSGGNSSPLRSITFISARGTF